LLLQEVMCVHGVLGLNYIKTVKFKILIIEELRVTVVWHMTRCNLVDEGESFCGTSYYPEHRGNKYLRNVGSIYQTTGCVIQ
jgi:hypothetical protein